MNRAFLGLYRRALAVFQAIAKAKSGVSPQMQALAASQIPQLQAKIQTLQGNQGEKERGGRAGQTRFWRAQAQQTGQSVGGLPAYL